MGNNIDVVSYGNDWGGKSNPGPTKDGQFCFGLKSSWDEFCCGFTNAAGVVPLMCDDGDRLPQVSLE